MNNKGFNLNTSYEINKNKNYSSTTDIQQIQNMGYGKKLQESMAVHTVHTHEMF
jgi:hypothetical protein